jgi:hypothetical protein
MIPLFWCLQDKLHHLEEMLFTGKDDKAEEKANVEKQREQAAEEKLRILQCKLSHLPRRLSQAAIAVAVAVAACYVLRSRRYYRVGLGVCHQVHEVAAIPAAARIKFYPIS